MTRDEKKTKAQLIEELAKLRESKRRCEAAPAGDSDALAADQPDLSGAITEQASDSVIATDLDFHIIYTNPAFRNLFGYSTEEMVGRTPDFLNAEPLGSDIQRDIYETVASGKTWRRAVLNRRKDGSTFTCDLAIFPLVNEHGDVFAYAGTQRDITESELVAQSLKASEEKARASEERFRNLAGMLPEAIFETDSDLRIVYANQRAFDLMGYSPQDMADGLHAFEMLVPEDRNRAQADFAVRISGEKPGSTEYAALRKDGSTLPVLFHANSIVKNGEFLGVRGVFVDLTEQKRLEADRRSLEAQIQHAQKLDSLGILAGGIAHDFNNLLMGVLGNAEMALADLPPASPVRASVQGVQTSAMRAAELAQQMLAYSGKGQFVVKPVSLSEVVREMGTLLTASVSKKTTLSYQLDETIPAIEADVAQVRQVALNLITNAVESLEDQSGNVTVRTGVMDCSVIRTKKTLVAGDVSEGAYSFLEVSDTGGGMDKETVGKMFDPFFTTKFTGRGLGLAALFGIVRGHMGAIQVASEVGQGTTVTVLFPCIDTPADSLRDNGDTEVELTVHGLILLVDDEQTVLEVGARMLNKAGYEVKTARDGNEAIEVFKKHSSDIDGVILDLTMPNMDGEETFVELLKIRKDVPVLLSSGYSVGDIEERLSASGFAGFLQKPYRMNGLLQALRKAISKGG